MELRRPGAAHPDLVATRKIEVVEHTTAPDYSNAHIGLSVDPPGVVYLTDPDRPSEAWRVTESGRRRRFADEAEALIEGEYLTLADLANDYAAARGGAEPEPYFVHTTAVDDLTPVAVYYHRRGDARLLTEDTPATAARYIAGEHGHGLPKTGGAHPSDQAGGA
jgi:hypothetical protein